MLNLLRRFRARVSAVLFIVSAPFLLFVSMLEPGEGGGGDGGEGGTGGSGEGGGGQGGGSSAGDAGDNGGGASDKTFTQAELDRIVQERVARAKSSPPADYDDLKAKAAKFDEIEAANKSELEKAQEKARKAEEAAAAATATAQETLKRTAVLVAATKASAADPNDVYALLSKEQKDALTIGNDGQVEGAEDAVKALLEAKPHLVGGKKTTSGSADGGPRESGEEKPKTLGEAVAKHYAKT